MMTYRNIKTVFLMALIVSVSCSRASQKPEVPITPAGQAFSQVVYPHTVSFKETKLHGQQFYFSKETCKGCHGQDLLGGNTKVSCKTCHTIFPHEKEFMTTFSHGTEFLKDRKVCTQCHGIDYKGGNADVSCHKCHPYPHEVKWALAEKHGAKYLEKDPTCDKCHNETSDFKTRHPEQFLTCGSCHTPIPHAEDFIEGRVHSKIARTYKGKCTICHTDQKRNLPNLEPDGCYSCHDSESVPKVKFPL